MAKLDADYWENRYRNNQIGWDIGYISTPLKGYIDQIEDKGKAILIPGGGNSYEAEYLLDHDFTDVTLLDYSPSAITSVKKRIGNRKGIRFFEQDFFEHEGAYDLILEQTFFCAIDPALRKKYVQKMVDLLNPNGRLVGLLWDAPMSSDGPPYGGSAEEYRLLFGKYFELTILEKAHNSIAPREGKEVFFNFIRK